MAEEPEELGTICEAKFDFDAIREDNISFKKGDLITLIEMNENGWWKGTNVEGDVGIFPYNYVQIKEYQESNARVCYALYEFIGRSEEELSFDVGDVIVITKELTVDWWEGRDQEGRVGRFPVCYVEQPESYDESIFELDDEEFLQLQQVEEEKVKEAEKLQALKAAAEERLQGMFQMNRKLTSEYELAAEKAESAKFALEQARKKAAMQIEKDLEEQRRVMEEEYARKAREEAERERREIENEKRLFEEQKQLEIQKLEAQKKLAQGNWGNRRNDVSEALRIEQGRRQTLQKQKEVAESTLEDTERQLEIEMMKIRELERQAAMKIEENRLQRVRDHQEAQLRMEEEKALLAAAEVQELNERIDRARMHLQEAKMKSSEMKVKIENTKPAKLSSESIADQIEKGYESDASGSRKPRNSRKARKSKKKKGLLQKTIDRLRMRGSDYDAEPKLELAPYPEPSMRDDRFFSLQTHDMPIDDLEYEVFEHNQNLVNRQAMKAEYLEEQRRELLIRAQAAERELELETSVLKNEIQKYEALEAERKQRAEELLRANEEAMKEAQESIERAEKAEKEAERAKAMTAMMRKKYSSAEEANRKKNKTSPSPVKKKANKIMKKYKGKEPALPPKKKISGLFSMFGRGKKAQKVSNNPKFDQSWKKEKAFIPKPKPKPTTKHQFTPFRPAPAKVVVKETPRNRFNQTGIDPGIKPVGISARINSLRNNGVDNNNKLPSAFQKKSVASKASSMYSIPVNNRPKGQSNLVKNAAKKYGGTLQKANDSKPKGFRTFGSQKSGTTKKKPVGGSKIFGGNSSSKNSTSPNLGKKHKKNVKKLIKANNKSAVPSGLKRDFSTSKTSKDSSKSKPSNVTIPNAFRSTGTSSSLKSSGSRSVNQSSWGQKKQVPVNASSTSKLPAKPVAIPSVKDRMAALKSNGVDKR